MSQYYRGFLLEADTFNVTKTVIIRDAETGTAHAFTGGPASNQIKHNGQSQIEYTFTTPFVANLCRDEPDLTDGVRWKRFGIVWLTDPWPEKDSSVSNWMNLGSAGAKYMRGLVLPLADANTSITVISSDGGSQTFGPFVIPATTKTPVAMAFTTPIVGHEFQIIPTGLCRKWPEEAKWDFDPWPERIAEASPWFNLGKTGAKYIRRLTVPMETGGVLAVFNLISSDGATFALGSTTLVNVKTPVTFAFSVPTIAHELQFVPVAGQNVRVWWDEVEWAFEPWPELIAEISPWMNLGTPGAKYMRGFILPLDTNGIPVTFTLKSSDGTITAFGPLTAASGSKTPVAVALTVPLIGHEWQIIPGNSCRTWYDEIRWDYDPWPELISEATGWMPVRAGGGASFLQGLIVPLEANGAVPSLALKYDNGNSVNLIAPLGPVVGSKVPVPFSLATPVICHEVQIVPLAPCRVWLNEIQWIAEPIPEAASTWTTQFTSHGLRGFNSVYRLEVAYSCTAPVTLTITVQDGTSPGAISLPSTGGVVKKVLITPTFNKGMLFRYSAVGDSSLRVFLPDWTIWIGEWGRPGSAIPWKFFGGDKGEGAKI